VEHFPISLVTSVLSSLVNLIKALLIRGDMNVSIVMTTATTIIGVVAIPGMIGLITGFFLDPCTSLQFENKKVLISIFITLAPCAIGMLIKAKCSDKITEIVLKIGKFSIVISMSLMVLVNAFIFKQGMFYLPLDVLSVCFIIPIIGFILGYASASVTRQKPRVRRTIMLETGLKNAPICLTILKLTFPIKDIGVLLLLPIYIIIFQTFQSIVLFVLFTKVLKVKDEKEQMRLLEYENQNQSNIQKQMSIRIAKKTETPVGTTTVETTTDTIPITE